MNPSLKDPTEEENVIVVIINESAKSDLHRATGVFFAFLRWKHTNSINHEHVSW